MEYQSLLRSGVMCWQAALSFFFEGVEVCWDDAFGVEAISLRHLVFILLGWFVSLCFIWRIRVVFMAFSYVIVTVSVNNLHGRWPGGLPMFSSMDNCWTRSMLHIINNTPEHFPRNALLLVSTFTFSSTSIYVCTTKLYHQGATTIQWKIHQRYVLQ